MHDTAKEARAHPCPSFHQAVIICNVTHSVGNFLIVHFPRVPPHIPEYILKYHVFDDPGGFIIKVLIFLEGLLPLIIASNIVISHCLLLPLVPLFLSRFSAATDATTLLEAGAFR